MENLCIRKITKEREMARMSAEVKDWGEVCKLPACVHLMRSHAWRCLIFDLLDRALVQ